MQLFEILIVVFAAALRVLPMRLVPHGGGVDQWYWRAYIERVRENRSFPPRLEQFRLEIAQWYPPFFPWLMARLPAWVFDQCAGYFSVCLDLLRMGMLMWVARQISGSSDVAILAGLVYASTPVLTTYNLQLNPRGLGALFFDAALLCMIGVVLESSWPWWIAAVPAGFMLMTHKMATQLFVFVCIVFGIVFLDLRFGLLLLLSVLVAMLISKGFYWYVFRHHWDIVRFWYRNWYWMGSNPVLESPIYGEADFESPSKYYRSGWRAAIRRLTFVTGFNPWMPAVLAVGAIAWWYGHEFSQLQAWAFLWLAATFAFALLTTLVPALRCFGQGYLYGYNGSFPAALAMGLIWPDVNQTWYGLGVLVVTVGASFLALIAFFRTLRNSRTLKVDDGLNGALLRLRELETGVVMCLPQHWHDVVAYRANKPVTFGGHGYGFRLIQQVFPRLLVPVKDFIRQNNVAYLLLWPAYVNQKFLDDLPPAEVEAFGDYRLYKFTALQEIRHDA